MSDRNEIDARMHRCEEAKLRPLPAPMMSSPCREHGCEIDGNGTHIWTNHKPDCPFAKMKLDRQKWLEGEWAEPECDQRLMADP